MYCGGYIPVRLKDLVVDVALRDLRRIEYEELEIEKELGQGGFGVVLKCRWAGQSVAVKKLLMEGKDFAR
jgi:predicted Ser/Thr protein kinase